MTPLIEATPTERDHLAYLVAKQLSKLDFVEATVNSGGVDVTWIDVSRNKIYARLKLQRDGDALTDYIARCEDLGPEDYEHVDLNDLPF